MAGRGGDGGEFPFGRTASRAGTGGMRIEVRGVVTDSLLFRASHLQQF